MHIKRFEAPTLGEALRQVREALGPDALVLETRKLSRGMARFGLGASHVVEVVAAAERALPEPVPASEPTDSASRAPGASAAPPAAGATPDPSWTALRLSRALIAPLEEELRELRRSLDPALGNGFRGIAPALPSQAGAFQLPLAEELAELRSLARDLRSGRLPPEAAAYLAVGIAPRHAEMLAAGSSDATPLERLARRLDECTHVPRAGQPEVLMLVGGTGCGKTTTLAKLAAREGTAARALISTDALRLGADEPLRAVASTLGIGFERAEGPDQVRRILKRHRSAPLLLDTTGIGRGDAASREELLRLRKSLGKRGRVQVVLSATTKESDLRAELARFGELEPEACVVTRTDESTDLANVVNLLLDDHTPPLSWIGNGRRIPDDLAPADPALLARSVLGGPA